MSEITNHLLAFPPVSIPGALFYIIFINDIANNVDVICLLFADDLSLFAEIDTINNCIKCIQMQCHVLKN